ncbi:MAG: hypothetical protein M1819_005881 [Sarea resinae]|nr:MAG: hypothetical protein M1819_005881 [Sarea resinae]
MATRRPQETEDSTLHLPRILCLHGGGVNAQVFRTQSRALVAQLESKFRLCFTDAPFLSQPGPGVSVVYKDRAPFRRWLRWLPEHPEIDAKSAVDEIEKSLLAAMREDDRKGATGEWVALLGFSQGALLSASLLFRQQIRAEKLGKHRAKTNYRFAVLLAGRAPLVSLDPDLVMTPTMLDASEITVGFSNFPNEHSFEEREHILRLPTIHVHGMRDQGLDLHRRLLEQYCEKGSTRLVEWDGDHRVPLKSKDVSAVAEEIFDLAKQTGALRE